MKIIFEEYGSLIIGTLSAILIFGILSVHFLSADSDFVRFLLYWGSGGLAL